MCHVDVIPIRQLPKKKLKQFENIMQKDTFRNIKSWFFQFQGILGLLSPKPKVVLDWRVLRTNTFPKNWLKSALIPFLCPLPKERFILNKNEVHTVKNHYLSLSVSFSAHKRGGSALFHLFGVTSRLFQVVLGFPSSLTSTCCNLFQVTPFVTNDELQIVLTCRFTKNELYVRYCYKMGSFLFYKTGLVVLQSRVGITEWHNFYNKMGGRVFQSGAIITEKNRIVQKDSDIPVLKPQSLKVKLFESQKIAWSVTSNYGLRWK